MKDEEQNHEEHGTASNEIELKPLSGFGKLMCYLSAFFLVTVILYGFTTVAADLATWGMNRENPVTRWEVISVVGTAYLLFTLARNLGDHWRSSDKNEIGTAVTNFPNPFYDPGFKKGPLMLQILYKNLVTQHRVTKKLLKQSRIMLKEHGERIEYLNAKLRVLLRHNDNSNRLLKSFNFLFAQKENDFTRKVLQHILAECITILEKDQSDKSISLFKVNGEELKIIESVRINAESIAKRTFEKGVGFAGDIWGKGKAEIVNKIDKEDARFNDQGLPATPIGSILGFPLSVDEDIIGVLCLQSEAENGFSNADLRTVEFYARLCTLILLYDKINNNGTQGGN